MKNPLTKSAASIAPVSAEHRLRDALAADPNIGPEMTALTVAVERFENIRAKVADGSIEAAAVEREAAARKTLVKLQAFVEIGQATDKDVAQARAEHVAAKEALEAMAGRNEVLTGELLKAQAVVVECREAFDARDAEWRSDMAKLAREAAAEGFRLIKLAAAATGVVGIYPGWPIQSVDRALQAMDVRGVEEPVFKQSAAIARLQHIRARADRAQKEHIEVTTAPKPAKTYRPTPSHTQGHPPAFYDALGNLKPGAAGVIAKQAALHADTGAADE